MLSFQLFTGMAFDTEQYLFKRSRDAMLRLYMVVNIVVFVSLIQDAQPNAN